MKHYRVLSNTFIKIPAHSSVFHNAENGQIFIPQSENKIFLHWKKGDRLDATLTLKATTLVNGSFEIVNHSENSALIQLVKL